MISSSSINRKRVQSSDVGVNMGFVFIVISILCGGPKNIFGGVEDVPDFETGGAVVVDEPEQAAALGGGPVSGQGTEAVLVLALGVELGGDGPLILRAEGTAEGVRASRHTGPLWRNTQTGDVQAASKHFRRQRFDPFWERPEHHPSVSKNGVV